MTSPSPRPTREEVDSALVAPHTEAARILAAEVRALRAELDAARAASRQIAEWRTAEHAELERLRAIDAAARKYTAGGMHDEFMAALGISGYEADAALTARTPQPAEPTVRDDLARNVAQLWRRDRAAADGQPMLVGRTYQGELWTALNQLAAAYVDAGAPQPAVPDGEDAPDLLGALQRSIDDARRKRTTGDGEDVPALLRSLADRWDRQQATYPDTCYGRAAAAAVRLCAREVRAAVTAALARPTGHQQ